MYVPVLKSLCGYFPGRVSSAEHSLAGGGAGAPLSTLSVSNFDRCMADCQTCETSRRLWQGSVDPDYIDWVIKNDDEKDVVKKWLGLEIKHLVSLGLAPQRGFTRQWQDRRVVKLKTHLKAPGTAATVYMAYDADGARGGLCGAPGIFFIFSEIRMNI